MELDIEKSHSYVSKMFEYREKISHRDATSDQRRENCIITIFMHAH